MAWSIRMIVVLALAVALAGFAACAATPTRDSMTPFKVAVTDPEAAIARLALFGIKAHFSDEENSLVVAESEELPAARILVSARMLPRGDMAYGFNKESNLSALYPARQTAYLGELQNLLAVTIAMADNVEYAIVNLAPPTRPYYHRFDKDRLRAKATVMVETNDSKPLQPAQVQAIAQLIAGAMETLRAENVSISDAAGKMYLANRSEMEQTVHALLAVYDPKFAISEVRTPDDKANFAETSIAITISDEFEISQERKSQLRELVSVATKVPVENISILLVPPLER